MKDLNAKLLFWASFLTLIAAGMALSIRIDIMEDWGHKFGFTQTELGTITGMGLFGFGLTIIFFSFFADAVGYGKLMVVAFLLHTAAVVITLAAPFAYQTGMGKNGAYWCLYIGQLCFSLANGTCEAVINPLTASLYPKNKTHWLNILHAGWPGGLVLGALVGFGLNRVEEKTGVTIGWPIRWSIVTAPILIYGLMMVGRPFPRSEAKEHGVSIPEMMQEIGMIGAAVAIALIGLWLSGLGADVGLPGWAGWAAAGVLWVVFGFVAGFRIGYVVLASLFALHVLVGYVELGTDSWIVDITKNVLGTESEVGGIKLTPRDKALIAFIWTNVLMFTLRFFAGPIVHRISPVGLLFGSAVVGTIGLLLLGWPVIDSAWLWLGAVTVYGIGKTFYWPTMLGVISERFPKGGALALGFSGGVGMLSAGILGGPVIGYLQDYAARHKLEDLETSNDRPGIVARYQAAEPPPPPLPGLQAVAGIDNAKFGVLKDNGKDLKEDMEKVRQSGETVTEEQRQTLKKEVDAWAEKGELTVGGYGTMLKLFGKLAADKDLKMLDLWWQNQGKEHAQNDKPLVTEAKLYGGRQALTWTAAVPATMAVGYLLILLYFRFTGGYKQVHLGEEPKPTLPEPGGYAPPAKDGHEEGISEGIPGEGVESTPL